MNNQDTNNIIAVELLSNTIDNLENKLTDKSTLTKNLKYNEEACNDSMEKDFSWITDVLQNVVDEYYRSYYSVDTFFKINLSNIETAVIHNLDILKNAKKLLKYASN